RIMDLEFIPAVNMPQTTPAPTPTSTTTTPTASPTASPTPSTGAGAVSQASLKLIQQFASTSILSSVKSATVSSDGKQLYLLTQTGSTLATISSIDKNPSCLSAISRSGKSCLMYSNTFFRLLIIVMHSIYS